MGVVRSLRSLTVLAGVALALAACGGDDGETSATRAGPNSSHPGEAVFKDAGCGNCHSLAAAAATGTVGPDLDSAAPDEETVVRQVTNGGNGMPSFRGRLTAGEIRNVADFVATSANKEAAGGALAAEFEPDDTKLEDCAGQGFSCYEQAFGNIAYEDGPKDALAQFEQGMRSDRTVEANCHRIAHMIGAAAIARYEGDAAKALVDGSPACWSGYYHGVIERAFKGAPGDANGLAQRAVSVCAGADVRRVTFIAYQCVHGLGHGLMIYTGYDLPLSLRACDRLRTDWDQTACSGGVFMENISSSYGIKSRWLRDNDLIYPCNVVAPRHKLYCYLILTSRILPAVGYNWQKAASLCRRSEAGWVKTCFQSLGRDASGQTRQNAREILSICRYAGDMERECVYGAARDITSNDAHARRAARMCAAADARLRPYCFEGVGTIVGGRYVDLEQRRAACRAITTRYAADCSRGAGA